MPRRCYNWISANNQRATNEGNLISRGPAKNPTEFNWIRANVGPWLLWNWTIITDGPIQAPHKPINYNRIAQPYLHAIKVILFLSSLKRHHHGVSSISTRPSIHFVADNPGIIVLLLLVVYPVSSASHHKHVYFGAALSLSLCIFFKLPFWNYLLRDNETPQSNRESEVGQDNRYDEQLRENSKFSQLCLNLTRLRKYILFKSFSCDQRYGNGIW